jgi:hypothetical protein
VLSASSNSPAAHTSTSPHLDASVTATSSNAQADVELENNNEHENETDELPWFVDPSYEDRPDPPHLPRGTQSSTSDSSASSSSPGTHARERPSHPPLPADAASSPALSTLYEALSTSPLMEPASLTVCAPPRIPSGPALPTAQPKGRRKRGGTEKGRGVTERLEKMDGADLGEFGLRMKGVPETGGLWKWVVLAQVKEGAEKRGGIESTIRLVRSTVCLSVLSTVYA